MANLTLFRATYSFQLNPLGIRPLRLFIPLLALIFFAHTPLRAAKILCVVSSPPAPIGNDPEVIDRLVAKGHTVDLVDDDDATVPTMDLSSYQLVLISSSVGSGGAGVNPLCKNVLANGRIPVVCYEPGDYDELIMHAATTFGNAGGHTAITINPAFQNHPLAAGKTGTIDIVEAGFTATLSYRPDLALPAGDAIIISSNATVDIGRINYWAYEKGGRLGDNATIATSRRVAFFWNATTSVSGFNTNAWDLFEAAVNWALQPPPNLPIIAAWRSPSAVNAAPGAIFKVELEDSTTLKVNTNTVSLFLNGAKITSPTISKSGAITTVSAPGAVLPAKSTNTASIVYSDNTPKTTTNVWTFVVSDYATLPPDWAYPVSAANTAAPGFKARIVQANTASGTLPNSEARAESQLAGTLIDPATRQPFANEASTATAGADGLFVDPDVINWNQDAPAGPEIGNFQAPAFADEPIPGIPGIDGINTDNIAGEVLTYLELQAGAYTFGVNSDDGFVAGAAPDARDALRTPAGRFDGGRGSADTTFTFVVQSAGLYSFRVLWYEGNGGANLEFFSVDPATGSKILINDRANAKAIKAWGQITAPTRPYVSAVSPRPNDVRADATKPIEFTLTNGGLKVNTNSIQVRVDGQLVSLASLASDANAARVSAKPALVGNKTYAVQLSYSDTGGNSVTNKFTFTTARSPITSPPIQQTAAGLAVVEAENFDANVPGPAFTWDFVKTPAGYTGDGTMWAPNSGDAVINYPASLESSPRLDYNINFIKTGTHYFWYRGSDGGGNSLNAGIDGDSPNDSMNNIDAGCCGTRLVPTGTSYVWVGSRGGVPASFEITAPGVHVINVWMREDGQIIDKLLITTDPAFVPSGAGPNESIRVGQVAPTIAITSPTQKQAFPANATVAITVNAQDSDGSVAKVEFFQGTTKIGESTAAPFSFQWTSVPDGKYTVSAKATDNTGVSATSSGVDIVVGNPPPQALFVGSAAGSAGDTAVIARLQSLGLGVSFVVDAAVATSDANNKDIIVISSTVGSGNISTKFSTISVPLLDWESAVYDELGFDANNTGGAAIALQTQIKIADATHPLAAGLPLGTVTVLSTAGDVISLATPMTSAKIIATSTDGNNTPVIFAFETGDALNGTAGFANRPDAAPARRVAFYLANNTFQATTVEGQKLFDAAVRWLVPNLPVPQSKFNAATLSKGQVTLSWTGAGQLEEASVVTGPWTLSPSQANPQTVVASGTKFYRIK